MNLVVFVCPECGYEYVDDLPAFEGRYEHYYSADGPLPETFLSGEIYCIECKEAIDVPPAIETRCVEKWVHHEVDYDEELH